MIGAAVIYCAGMWFLLRLIDRRMHAAQAAREAAFLRRGFGSGVLVQQFERDASRNGGRA